MLMDAEYHDENGPVRAKAYVTRSGDKTRVELLRPVPVDGTRQITLCPRDDKGHFQKHITLAATPADDKQHYELCRDEELEKLLGADDDPLNLKQTDAASNLDWLKAQFAAVHAELIEIRQCRGNLFIATLVSATTAALALIGFVHGFGGVDNARPWIAYGAAIPLLLLAAAILVHIEKVHVLRDHEGFLCALGSFVSEGKLRCPSTLTWLNANMAANYCLDITRKGQMPPCGEAKDCLTLAKEKASSQNDRKPLLHWNFLISFTGLSMAIYAVLYVSAGIVFVWAIGVLAGNTSGRLVLHSIILVLGMLLMALFVLKFLLPGQVSGDSDATTPVGRIARIVLSFVVFVVLMEGVAYTLGVENAFGWRTIIPVIASVVVIGVGLVIYRLVYDLRKGQYSIATRYHLWRQRLGRCPFLHGHKHL